MADQVAKKYRDEVNGAVELLKVFISSHEARLHKLEELEDALKTLAYAARDATRWAERMLLLERRLAAIRKIGEGATEVSVEPAAPESRSLVVLLRYDEARMLVQETDISTGRFSAPAQKAYEDIAWAIAEHPATAARGGGQS